MGEISDMDWVQHIKMHYAQSLIKGQKKDHTGWPCQNETFYCIDT